MFLRIDIVVRVKKIKQKKRKKENKTRRHKVERSQGPAGWITSWHNMKFAGRLLTDKCGPCFPVSRSQVLTVLLYHLSCSQSTWIIKQGLKSPAAEPLLRALSRYEKAGKSVFSWLPQSIGSFHSGWGFFHACFCFVLTVRSAEGAFMLVADLDKENFYASKQNRL